MRKAEAHAPFHHPRTALPSPGRRRGRPRTRGRPRARRPRRRPRPRQRHHRAEPAGAAPPDRRLRGRPLLRRPEAGPVRRRRGRPDHAGRRTEGEVRPLAPAREGLRGQARAPAGQAGRPGRRGAEAPVPARRQRVRGRAVRRPGRHPGEGPLGPRRHPGRAGGPGLHLHRVPRPARQEGHLEHHLRQAGQRRQGRGRRRDRLRHPPGQPLHRRGAGGPAEGQAEGRRAVPHGGRPDRDAQGGRHHRRRRVRDRPGLPGLLL